MITNKTPKSVTIHLTGAQNKSIIAPPGKTTVQLTPGKYEYSYSVCGADKKGKLNLALPQGVTKVRVVKGIYRYSLSVCGGSPTNGTIVIKNGHPLTVWCKKQSPINLNP